VETRPVKGTHFTELVDAGILNESWRATGLRPWVRGSAALDDFLKVKRYMDLTFAATGGDRVRWFPAPVFAEMRRVVRTLETEDKVFISDRKLVKLYKLFRFRAWLFANHGPIPGFAKHFLSRSTVAPCPACCCKSKRSLHLPFCHSGYRDMLSCSLWIATSRARGKSALRCQPLSPRSRCRCASTLTSLAIWQNLLRSAWRLTRAKPILSFKSSITHPGLPTRPALLPQTIPRPACTFLPGVTLHCRHALSWMPWYPRTNMRKAPSEPQVPPTSNKSTRVNAASSMTAKYSRLLPCLTSLAWARTSEIGCRRDGANGVLMMYGWMFEKQLRILQ
jgi:hypothetical protein